MSDGLHIVRIKTPARVLPYYYIRERGKAGKDILALGHDKDVETAYARALGDYLRAAQRLQQFEMVLPRYQAERARRG